MRASWMAIAIALAVPNAALAQDQKRVDAAAGYSWMRDYDGNVSFPRGWFASVGGDVAGPLTVVGDASGSYKSAEGLDVKLSVSIHTVAGGPRFVWRSRRAAPYAQMLFGATRTATTYETSGEHLTSAQTHFTMAPGGGVDIPFSNRGAVRVGANVRLIRSETFTPTGSRPTTYRELQIVTGLVFR